MGVTCPFVDSNCPCQYSSLVTNDEAREWFESRYKVDPSRPLPEKVALIRKWRDGTAERFGPGGSVTDAPAAVPWRDIDTLLQFIDHVSNRAPSPGVTVGPEESGTPQGAGAEGAPCRRIYDDDGGWVDA